MSLVPVPEIREMVETARRYVAGEVHFSYLVGPTEKCLWWTKVHNSHTAIRALAEKWLELAGRVWNEHGQYTVSLPEDEFRRQVAEDLKTL